ncbi:hypothetical protein JHK84_027495 [Glycine max]|nr:hypothetical protein JHK84_027495 [Glycine max]
MTITAVTLVALFAEIVYVLWQRRQRLRPRVRVEPQEASLQCSSTSSSPSNDDDVELELEQHVMKWQQCLNGNGPSRMLFTIKEEEREEVESDNGNGLSEECKKSARACLDNERVAVVDEVVVAVEELLLLDETTTPFSTPCASPPYYTPYASPSREECRKDSNDGRPDLAGGAIADEGHRVYLRHASLLLFLVGSSVVLFPSSPSPFFSLIVDLFVGSSECR